MVDETKIRMLLDYFPVIVTALQSGLVKAFTYFLPQFARLKPWAKILGLFVVGLGAYTLLDVPFKSALLLSAAGTAAAAVIYFFGRQPDADARPRIE